MRPLFYSSAALALLVSTACAENETASASEPAEMETAAVEAEAAAETSAQETASNEAMDDAGRSTLSSGTYEMDKTHGYVTFSYLHQGYSRPVLRFDDVDATVTYDAEDPSASALMVEIDPASINSGVADFDQHLKSGDFFEVETYDSITFESTDLTFDSPTTGTLTGDLTMKGVTKPVTLDVVLNRAAEHPMQNVDAFGISATGQIMRSEWDLGLYTPYVGDAVDLRIEAEFLKAE